ncbi:MAG: Gfo/Idh/MocA family oxidoreductase [Candidatus Bathyarchaeia archaeon]
MALKEIGFGVVGLGMGRNRCELVSKTEGAVLRAVVDVNEERAREVASNYGVDWYRDYSKLLARKDVDVVYVLTPSGLHAEMAVEAARAGKHVITTKPMCVSLKQADAMIRECRRAKVKLAVDFESRYLPDMLRIRKWIDDGRFGKLILGEARLKWYRSQEYYSTSGWRGTWRYDGGGSLMNQTVHLIDLLQWYMGPADSVTGRIGVFTHQIETEDLGAAIINFKNGAVGTVLGTTTCPKDTAFRIEIHGDRGLVITEGNVLHLSHFLDGEERTEEEFLAGKPRNVVEDMIRAIREDEEPLVTGEEGRKSVELVLAIYQSSMSGKRVKLPLRKDLPFEYNEPP